MPVCAQYLSRLNSLLDEVLGLGARGVGAGDGLARRTRSSIMMRVPMPIRRFTLRRAALAATALLAAAPAAAQESTFDELSAPVDSQVPIVTPTYLRQAVRDIPATVTILDAETLATYGLLTIPNALRIIEGTPAPRISWVSYDLKTDKGSFGPPRITVMIDGIEVDSSYFASSVDWQALPVSVDDIERVEVTRGPSTAGFGHALTTVLVNIVTKHPADVERAFVRGSFGSFNTQTIFGRAGFSAGPMAVRLTLARNTRDAVDDQGLSTLRSGKVRIDRVNLRTSTRVDAQTILAIDAAYLEANVDGLATNALSNDLIKHSGFASGVWTRSLTPANELSVRMEQWFDLVNSSSASCGASQFDANRAATPAATPSVDLPPARSFHPLAAADPECIRRDNDEHRTKLEVQDVHVVSESLRAVGGVGLRQEAARTSTPGAARWSATFTRVFGGVDWQPDPAWTVNAGLSFEHDASDEYDNSLRAGVNWHLADTQTLRASWSTGDWASQVYKVLDQTDDNNNVVTQERMNAADVGYLFKIPEHNVQLDARVFWMGATGHLWPLKAKPSKQKDTAAHGEIWGLETRGSAELTARVSAFLGFAYGKEGDTSNIGDKKDFWSAAVGASAQLLDRWRAALSYTTSTQVQPVKATPGIASATLLKEFLWLEARMRGSITYRHVSSVPTQVGDQTVGVSQDAVYATLEAAF